MGSGPYPFVASSYPVVKLQDWNDLLTNMERGAKYFIRENGSYTEAIQGGGTSDAGRVVFGGSGNAGGIDGTSSSAVILAAIDGADAYDTIACMGSITLDGEVTIDKTLNFLFDCIYTDVDDEAGLIIDGASNLCLYGNRLEYTSSTAYTESLLKILDLTHGDIRINSVYHDYGVGGIAGTGVKIDVQAGTSYAWNKMQIQSLRGFDNGLYITQAGDGWIGNNRFDIGIIASVVKGVILEQTGTGAIFDNVIDTEISSPGDVDTVVGWCIYATSAVAKKIVNNTFYNYAAWDMATCVANSRSYYANANVLGTLFVGGMPRMEDPDLWEDLSNSAEFIGCWVVQPYGAGDADLGRYTRTFSEPFVVSPCTQAWTAAVGGTGGTAQYPLMLNVYTGVNAGSDARLYTYSHMASPLTGYTGVYYDKWFELEFLLGRGGTTGTNEHVGRFQLKKVTTEGALADVGVGIQVTDLTVIGEAYDSARSTTGTLTTLSTTIPAVFRIEVIPASKVNFYVNDVFKESITAGTGVPTGSNISYLVQSAVNGAAASEMIVNSSNIKLKTRRWDY